MHVLVTAGPTREPIDPVRFISNRSSGKMGYAVAAAFAARGHEVVLVSGPVALAAPAGVSRVQVQTADEMLAAVSARLEWCGALVMAAAVADWRPRRAAAAKLKKAAMPVALELEAAPDILRALAERKGGRVFVGFAAETGDPLPEARRKLREKKLDLIVANDVSRAGSGFEADTNKVTLLPAGGAPIDLPLMSKRGVAERIAEWVLDRAAGASAAAAET